MHISAHDKDILRKLAEQKAEIAALSVHDEKAELWRRVNQLDPVRPVLWINEIPWHEMNVDDELTLCTTDPFAQQLETTLRRELYQWWHMPGDMIVSPYIECPKIIHSTGVGFEVQEDIVRIDDANEIVSHGYIPQITEPEDVEKIQNPVVTYDETTTLTRLALMQDIFAGTLPVKLVGKRGHWFAPWDNLITWWEPEQALLDLMLRPEMVHAIVSRLIEAYLCELNQWTTLDMLSSNNNNTRIGSGGYGYTNELPLDHDAESVPLSDIWGCCTAQIFVGVSPAMHWEFALQYEMAWLEQFGLTYYGCCEPLDMKLDILRRIPNLRKISMSPWVEPGRGAENIGLDYVYSYKPNPAIVAEDTFSPARAEAILRETLVATRQVGCSVEVILKDISTVRYDPTRLWQWHDIVMRQIEEDI